MVKRILIIGLIVIAYSCIPTKNDYSMVRYKPVKFSIKPNHNKNFIKYVDTSSFYIAIHSDKFIKKYNLQDYTTGFKFYGNGKVGFIKGVNFLKPESFNSERASMGYYNFIGGKFYIETLYSGPGLLGSNYMASKKEILLNKSSKDTLFIKNFKSSRGSDSIAKYVRMDLPKEFLIYKPDW